MLLPKKKKEDLFRVIRYRCCLFISATPAAAAEITPSDNNALLTSLWLIVAGCLVFLMQAGFALVEAGLTQLKTLATSWRKTLRIWLLVRLLSGLLGLV